MSVFSLIPPTSVVTIPNATDFTLPFMSSESSSKVNIRCLYKILNRSVIVSNFARM